MKRRIKSMVGALLLALAVAATQIPASDVEASTSDFQLNGTTLIKYTGSASTATIPDNVKTIGTEAFAGNTTLASVTIPSGVTHIEAGAFADCKALEHIVIPKGVEELGNGVFAGDARLTKVTLGRGVKKLGNGVFAGCTGLSAVEIAEKNKYFVCEDGVIYNKDKTKIYQLLAGREGSSFSFPSTVTDIAEYAFWGAANLQRVTLSSSLRSIPAYAFSNCKALQGITVPFSVKNIDLKAFENCVNLKDVEIPSSVSQIHDTAFDGCGRLNIIADEGSTAFEYAKTHTPTEVGNAEYEDINKEQDTGEDDTEAEEETENKQEVYVSPLESPEDQAVLGKTVIVNNSAVIFIDNTKQVVNHGNTGASTGKNSKGESVSGNDGTDGQTARLLGDADKKGFTVPKYAIAGNSIASQAFYKDTSLQEYEFPEGLESIGEFSFARSGLKSIKIPDGITSIGYGAFYHCDNLESVYIPDSVTEIEPSAFEKTKWLENWKKNGTSDFLIVGDGLLIAYRGTDSRVEVPEGVKAISANVFKDHQGLVSVALPETLSTVGEAAFSGCINLTDVTGGVHVTRIADRAFEGCPIETIRIPGEVTEIGLKAYDLTGTDKSEQTKVAVFHGTKLPELSYEKTSTRLSNPQYRDLALKGVQAVIVDESIDSFKDTVLDASVSGFRGIVCSVEKEEDAFGSGTVRIKYCSLEPDAQGNLDIPETLSFYGHEYTVTNAQDAVSELKASGKASVPAGFVSVISWNDKFTDTDVMSAVIDGDTGMYKVVVGSDENADRIIRDAYESIYGDSAAASFCAFDLSCYEESSDIPITRLGKQYMYLVLPLPEEITASNLHIVCTDEDGQLEEVPYQLVEENGRYAARMQISHFSPYAMYNYSSGVVEAESKVSNGSAVFTSLESKKDDSPNTGDAVHPKWFLAGGLFFSALAVFFYKGKRSNIRYR